MYKYKKIYVLLGQLKIENCIFNFKDVNVTHKGVISASYPNLGRQG